MKIEMGESLMLSWAKHVKNCQIATLNWKCSDCWEDYNYQEITNLIEKMKVAFSADVFGKAKDAKQIIGQAELDVLGININNHAVNNIYAIDVAFHENGLGYDDNLHKITEKLLRSALVLYSVFNSKTGKIIFASPKVQPKDIEVLQTRTIEIENFMKNLGFDFQFSFICNQDFYEQILEPVQQAAKLVSDTSELFMRCLQMVNICKKHEGTKSQVLKPRTGHSTGQAKLLSTELTKEYILHGNACSNKEFEKYLRNVSSCVVYETVLYSNKPESVHEWHVNNFSSTSNLNGNLHSGILRDWQSKGIIKIILEIK